ncbi:MAG: myristoyl transferase [Dehalococcoidia bacterium]|nr:myristoyl transferase [Dehalococcoidia bacterium]
MTTTPRRTARTTRLGATVLALLALATATLVACDDDDPASADADPTSAATGTAEASGELTEVTLMLNWTPNNHHAGIYIALAEGWYEEAGLDLEIVEPATAGGVAVVAAGQAEFGIGVAESIIPARAEGAPVVSIAAILPFNASSLMALASEGIERPSDLQGKTYGGFGGALEQELLNTLVECDGGDPSQVEFVEVGNIDYLAGMEQDRFDFVWVFEGWDALRASEVEGVEVSSLKFVDYLDCIPDWYTPAFITNETMLAEQPDLVRAFLEATARGYDRAIEDPDAAADALLAAAPELDEGLVRASAEYHAPLYAADGQPWGVQDPENWERFEAFLREAGLTETEVDPDATFTNEYLPES